MDQATQQNAALVEESAAAAGSLKGQAEQLVQSVAFFQLAGGSACAPTALDQPRSRLRPAAVARAVPPHRPAAALPPAARKPAPSPAATAKDDDWESF
jgi:hypothetical protein